MIRSSLKIFRYVLVLVLVASCATGGKRDRTQLRNLLTSNAKLEEVLAFIDNSKFYQEEKSKLLRYLDRGMAYHIHGLYYPSTVELEKAKDLARKLYTTSLSTKAQTMIMNDNYDIYYGEKYEHSLIRFYLSLNHYMIWQKGIHESYTVKASKKGEKDQVVPEKKLSKDERQRELMAARAELLDWDSYLKDLKFERAGESVFKNDMLAKVYGGAIHEAVGTRDDQQIALQLYKDAKNLLIKNYSAYRSFNKKFVAFKSDFSNFHKYGIEKVKKDYINGTNYQTDLIAFLDYKILSLTKRIRPGDFKNQVKIQNPQAWVVNMAKAENGPNNVSLVIQKGLIPQKVADKHFYGLEAALTGPNATPASRAAAKVGVAALTIFASHKLGLLPPPHNYNPGAAYLGIKMTEAAVAGAAVSFELPKIQNVPLAKDMYVIVTDKAGAEVLRKRVPLINPIGDIAEEAVAENSAARYGRIGFRLATKYVAAIAATYAIYKKTENPLARSAALLGFAASTRGIAASEKADTRYWSTLPSDLRFISFNLKPGDYNIKIVGAPAGSDPSPDSGQIYSGALTVEKGQGHQMLNIRALN